MLLQVGATPRTPDPAYFRRPDSMVDVGEHTVVAGSSFPPSCFRFVSVFSVYSVLPPVPSDPSGFSKLRVGCIVVNWIFRITED
jgi:hypothetical protein